MWAGIMKKAKIAGILALQVCLLIVFSACGAANEGGEQEAKNVKAVRAAMSPIRIDVEYPGKLKACEEVTVSSKISGRVAEIKAEVGDAVGKGQVLFTLDTKDADALLKQSRAGLEAADANLERTGGSALSQQIIQAETALKQAQVRYDDAKRLFEKMKTLYEQGAISRQQYDDAESGYKNAGIQRDSARDSLNLLRDKAGPQSVNVAAAQVEQARATLEQASIQVGETSVISPIAGTVSARNIEKGELVSSSLPAYTVIDVSALTVEVNTPSGLVGKLQKGLTVPVVVNALGGKSADGVIDVISPAADARTQGYIVKIRIENKDGLLKPGMFGRVMLPAERRDSVLAVPNEAVVIENSVQYVYTVAGGRIRKKAVTAGLSTDRVTEITGGLSAGEYVVTEGQTFLNDGDRVKVIDNQTD